MVRHSAELCPQKNYLLWMKLLGYANCFGNAFARCFLNSRIVKRIYIEGQRAGQRNVC